MSDKKHYNEHRKTKKSFQVMLTQGEQELLELIKNRRGIEQNKKLLITILKEEEVRILTENKKCTGRA